MNWSAVIHWQADSLPELFSAPAWSEAWRAEGGGEAEDNYYKVIWPVESEMAATVI